MENLSRVADVNFTCCFSVAAFKLFLNGENGICRDLILQLLVPLWQILHWARRQCKVRLFSSSILLIYDARKLRQHLKAKATPPLQSSPRPTCLYKPLSIMKLNGDHICNGFSGQFTQDGPILTPTSKYCNFANNHNTAVKVSTSQLSRKVVFKQRILVSQAILQAAKGAFIPTQLRRRPAKLEA